MLEDLPDFGRGIQEVGRAACDFHLHFRTIGETEGPFRGNVPQDTYVYADRSFGIAFEPGGYQGAISCLGEQFGVLSLPAAVSNPAIVLFVASPTGNMERDRSNVPQVIVMPTPTESLSQNL